MLKEFTPLYEPFGYFPFFFRGVFLRVTIMLSFQTLIFEENEKVHKCNSSFIFLANWSSYIYIYIYKKDNEELLFCMS